MAETNTLKLAGGEMQIAVDILGALYLVVVYSLAFYGFYNLINTLLFLRVRNAARRGKPVGEVREWPAVTVQLPIFNEKYTVEALLRAVTHLDYPRERLQVQVL